MKKLIIILLIFLSGCMPLMNRGGYKDGYDSGAFTAGSKTATFYKADKDEQYQKEWDKGFADGRARYNLQ